MDEKIENLKRLFEPETVAVVGASGNPSKLGFHVMKSLVTGGYAGRIVPVNPRGEAIFGLSPVPDLAACPGAVDLARIRFAAGTRTPPNKKTRPDLPGS